MKLPDHGTHLFTMLMAYGTDNKLTMALPTMAHEYYTAAHHTAGSDAHDVGHG